MINATIEAAALAPPQGTPNSTSLRSYISRLLHWAEIASNSHTIVLVTRATQTALVLTGSFPVRPWLAKMLATTCVVEFDANTVARLVEKLLSRAEILEDRVLISDLLFDSLTLTPNVFPNQRPTDLRWEGEKAAIILAILNRFGTDSESKLHCLVTESPQSTKVVNVRCRLSVVEHTRSDLAALPTSPSFFEASAPIGDMFAECVTGLDEVKILQAATSLDQVQSAVRIALCKYRISNGQSASCLVLPAFGFNGHFMTCLSQCGVFTNPALAKSTLRAVVETLENIQMADVHSLRTGAGPTAPQITRGNDLAWRRDIDHEYHLHYWQCAGDVKELACIVPHRDVHICR